MAVYTHLGAEDLARLIGEYDVGDLVMAKGIAEGVSNSNWLVETTGSGDSGTRFILTLYERRIDYADLPYFLGLLDHLAGKGCPVPRTMHDRVGASWRMVEGKAAALIEFLPGVSPTRPTPAQARSIGAVLANLHLAAQDFPQTRTNAMDFAASAAILEACGAEALATIDTGLPAMIDHARTAAALDLAALSRSQTHTDLFPDNVLMLGDEVSGVIDFYFACTDIRAWDVAVTHTAWCFENDGNGYHADVGRALIAGYHRQHGLSVEERLAFPILARGACLRFLLTRAFDWINTPADAMVTRKDPIAFLRRLDFYAEADPETLVPA